MSNRDQIYNENITVIPNIKSYVYLCLKIASRNICACRAEGRAAACCARAVLITMFVYVTTNPVNF